MHIFYQVFKQLYEKKLILISNFRKSKTNKNCGFQNYVLHSLQNQTISLYWCQTKIAKCFIIVHIPLIIRQINIVDKILTCRDIKSKKGFIGQLLRHKNCCKYSLAVMQIMQPSFVKETKVSLARNRPQQTTASAFVSKEKIPCLSSRIAVDYKQVCVSSVKQQSQKPDTAFGYKTTSFYVVFVYIHDSMAA